MHYIHLARPTELPDISGYRPFRAVIIAEHSVSPELRYEISQWLVDSGCLYVMVWGSDCCAWEYAVDTMNIEHSDYGDIPDEHLVMTTTHDDDSLEDLFSFAKICANHSAVELEETLLVHIADTPRQQELLLAYHDS